MNLRDGVAAYVLALLSTRSFRISTGAVYLAASGYPDLVPNLNRTSWEIGIRILAMQEDPIAASYGYLLKGVATEIRTLESEIAHRLAIGDRLGNLKKNLERIKAHRDELAGFAREQSCDPEQARNKYGNLNVRQVCERFGIEKAYFVTFAWDSGFVHESNLATPEFSSQHGPELRFEAGPLVDVPDAAAIDALRQCSFVLLWSTQILRDKQLAEMATECVNRLHEK